MNFVLGWVGITDMETQTEERTHLQQILYLSAIILGYPKNFPSPYERVTMHSLEAPKANVFFVVVVAVVVVVVVSSRVHCIHNTPL